MNQNKIVYASYTFQGDNVKEGRVYLAASLLSSKLEANSFSATVKSSTPALTNFQRNTPLTWYYNGRQRGIFYVQDISRVGPDLYRISATSAIGLLIEGSHYGGIYTGQTVAAVLPSICGTVPYVIKGALANVKLYGWLPVASPRDNLSQVLFALGATVKTDLNGVLRIEGLWDGLSGTQAKERIYQGAEVAYTAKVTQVAVTEHQYVTGGESKTLFEGTAQQGDIITFDEPMYNLTSIGFTIQERGANYAKVSSGTGTLTGVSYIHNMRQVTKTVTSAAKPNIKTVKDATLVSLINSTAIAERLANFYKCVQTIDAKATYDGEIPGDLLAQWHPYEHKLVSACLQSAEITMSNVLAAQEKALVGFEPLQDSEVSYINEYKILTGSGTWTVPAGVTSVRAVLIGGGTGGSGGKNGNAAPAQAASSGGTTSSVYMYKKLAASIGGTGGAAGTGGTAGKILEVTLTVTPGSGISYSCGTGGAGGAAGAAGSAGTATTFSGRSSANGTVRPGGFEELFTHVIYALPGGSGVAGGQGAGFNDPTADDNWSTQVGGTNVVFNGVTYRPGSPGSFSEVLGPSRDILSGRGGAGAGGGPCAGKNGGTGGNGSVSYTSRTCSAYTGTGGAGASPSARSAQTRLGSGGDGGHGAGGGGGAGYTVVQLNSPSTNTGYTYNVYQNSAGKGGTGGTGGRGGPGGIILYYSVPQVVPSGGLMDKKHRIVLDKHGRLIVA